MARGKTAIPLDLPRPPGLSGRCAQSKQDCIGDALRDAILRKLLPGGSLLPSTRTLAARWGVARGTVEAAFDRLCAEGYIARMRGSGTRVSAVVPDDYLASAQRPAKPASRPRGEPAAHVARKRAAEPDGSVRAGVPFVARLADPALLPMRTWKRHVCKGLSDATPAALCTLSPQGAEPLRARIADYLGQYRGIACSAADIFITTGIRHSIDLIARTIVGDDSRIALEEPGYRAARRIFELAGAESIGVPVDPEGIDTNALSAHRRVAAAYVTPAHQAPLGVTMSVSRRLDLLDWAYARHAWVIEDDYDGEFGYQSAPLPALKSLDVRDRVIYCGSFNKTLFSGMRVGFMVAPAALRASISALSHAAGRSVGTVEQLALASFVGSGDFAKHLRTSRHAYLQRRDAVLEQLRRHADGRYAISGEHAGFHFVLWLGRGIDERAFVEEAAKAGLVLEPLRAFSTRTALPAGVVVGYSALSVAQARYAGKKLGQLLAGMRRVAAA
ncbi:aminotransferase class I and II family protein [Burkholderia thailandensis 34]|uniref:MocR-like pyridoxine biosynthesis transcription factor PdxR n=1 Tax=Burkholderia thailandensis TaxID=57975 RepID=UPI0005D82891|nr:PLP-dependent aminotransferase family protein [Burkholderia thailandensis]AJY31184.1 aminotransferase class I and II family protein [Burkholderia thailandensis 34]AOJ60309.1 GntR family transcriptional regulator [Burkholderia thailandensis]KXF57300.1 GntR family transcriptional regulator [Burkholderia thailandensis]PNE77965.1 PLP-dependent aminotransferase family protein [Burkholderia thailandensis]